MIDMISTLNELVSACGISGAEREISEKIKEFTAPYADEIKTDVMGNLIVRKKGKGKKIMLSAHMDSIGMIVTFIEKEGFLRFANVGYLNPYEILHSPVIFEDKTLGIIAPEQKAEMKSLKLENLYIDIGTQRESSVQIGDTAVFSGKATEQNGMIISPYLDNRAGCLVLIMALAEIKDNKNDLYFVFSAQEEIGLRGAKTAAYAIEPDYALAVDVTDTGDLPEIKTKMECSAGKGPAIKIMDNSVLCHKDVVTLLKKAAEKENIPYQYEIMQQGGTDAGAIHVSRDGVYTGAVSIPTRYIHTPYEMASIADIKNCVRLIKAAADLF